MNHVVVIEAPGKISQVARLFRERGETVLIAATRGHLYDLPEDSLGIDIENLRVSEWVVRHPEQLERVKEALNKAERVTLLTDADVEGEVIAAEVQPLIPSGIPTTRVRLTALTDEALERSLAEVAPGPDPDLVAQGLARRITDRILGYAFQDPESHHIALGRIVTPTLQSFLINPPVIGQIEVALGQDTGIGPWRCILPFKAHEAGAARLLAQALATLPAPAVNVVQKTVEPLDPRPHDLGSALLTLSERFNCPLREVEANLQSLYMRGRMTYARTASRHLSADRIKHIERLAGRQGLSTFDRARLLRLAGVPNGPHEALAPTGLVPLDARIDDLAFEEQCLVAITERLIDAGQKIDITTEHGQFHPSPASDEWQAVLRRWKGPLYLVRQWRTEPPFCRPTPWEGDRALNQRGRPAWKLNRSAIYTESPERQVLNRLLDLGLGQPSTLVSLSSSIASRFLDEHGRVNGLARQALAHAREQVPALLDPEAARALDRCFSKLHTEASARVRAALESLNLKMADDGRSPIQTADPTLSL